LATAAAAARRGSLGRSAALGCAAAALGRAAAALGSVRERVGDGGSWGALSSQPKRQASSRVARKMLRVGAVEYCLKYRLLWGLLLLTLSTGCSRIQKTRECRHFAAMINGHLAEIETLVKPRSAAGYRAGSVAYAKLAAALRADKTSPGELSAGEFAQAFEAAGRASLALAEGLDAKDQHRQDEARRELDRLSRQEHGLVLRTNVHCENP
jgi:hypothetical protein